ncbi:secreted glycosyl hydrolase [Minicystis rosea]|nr:secreted glycosyl hydrolase [Minicystis rosea]
MRAPSNEFHTKPRGPACMIWLGAFLSASSLLACAVPDEGDEHDSATASDALGLGTYQFGALAGTSKCLDVSAASTADGALLQSYSCNGTPAQSFRVESLGGSNYRIVNSNSGKCVDVKDHGTANGTPIQQWSCATGNDAQSFLLEDAGGGMVRIVHGATGKCLDVAAASTADGAKVQLYTCNGTTAQTWVAANLAAATFHNTGTLSGWDFINREHNGSVNEVTNVTYKGTTALKVTQIYDPSYTGRYHSEVVKNKAYRRGDTGFYGFAFRLQADWQFQPQSYNIAQFIADFSDTGCDDYMPSSMIWLQGNQLYTRVKNGSICNQHIQTFGNLATVTAGEWHTVVIQAKWASDGTGVYKLWFDGNKVLDKSGLSTTIADDRYFQLRVGLYANGWHDTGYMQGSQATRSIWYDEIGMGPTFTSVDPAQW